MRSRFMALLVALGAAGCSWSQFDDLERNPPVLLLNKPDKMRSGFGVTMATATVSGKTSLIIGGGSGKSLASIFDLGNGQSPKADAVDTGSCSQETPCYLADHLAGLGKADVGTSDPKERCFILGIGNADRSADYGLTARCVDRTEYTLPVPRAVVRTLAEKDIAQDTPEPLVLSTDKDEAPALVAGAPSVQLAWLYKPLSMRPIQLIPPGEPDSDYGAAVAALRLVAATDAGVSPSLSRIIAVGAPARGHVWLFSGDDGSPVGCLGGPARFGRTLSTGDVSGDGVDDLVVADAANVTVISGVALSALGPATDITCSLAALPAQAIITSFGCGSRDTVAGCPGGFGTALDVGDLDGDGDGEVLVGAPDMKVRGTRRAGAVLVYDAEGDHPELLTDQLFLSSAKSDDALGGSVVAAHIAGRDVVVAGAPGKGRAAVFFCSALLGGQAGGSRCQ